MATEFTKKQRACIDHYLVNFKQVDAYKAAGYSPRGNKGTHSKNSSLFFNLPKIKAEIQRRITELESRSGINCLRIERAIEKIAFKTEPKNIITTMEQLKALELLGKRHGMFEQKHKVSVEFSFDQFIKEAYNARNK